MKSTDRQIDVCVPFAPVEWGNNTQRGAQAQRISRGLGLRVLGVRCSCKAKLVERMGTWDSGGAAGGGDWHFVLPFLWRCPKGARTTAVIKGPLQLPDLELSWGLGDCQTCALEPSSFSLHLSKAVGQGRGFPLGSWALPLHRKYMAVFGVSSVPPVPAPEESRDQSCCVQGWQGCSWHSACAQHALHWTLSPVPPQEVSLLACVTNWAGKARPACAAAPAGLGTQPAPLEMPPGTSCFCLGLSKVENKP